MKRRSLAGFVLVIAALLSLGLVPVPAPVAPVSADVGDLVATVEVPEAARCGIGTSVAIATGTQVNLPQYPVLLVISCYQDDKLNFIDPASQSLVKTITTTPTPSSGWGSLSLRGDRNDILGCGQDGLYSIDIDAFNAVADGTATQLANPGTTFGICDGVAWDADDDTIYQSPDATSVAVYHYDETGGLIESFPPPDGCPNSGLAVGGSSLFLACNGVTTIIQTLKASHLVQETFSAGGSRTEDLECDPISFPGIDVMWSKDAYDNGLFAFEIPDGTCGAGGGGVYDTPECQDTDGNNDTDNDDDALCDNWEQTGIDFNKDGTTDLTLYDDDQDGTVEANERPSINHKDIYVEVDWMGEHRPRGDAIQDVVRSFAAGDVSNPDGTSGVRLHVIVDEEVVGENDALAFQPCTAAAGSGEPDFDDVKSTGFGTDRDRLQPLAPLAKNFVFHYSLWVHGLKGQGGVSGCAELPGNDFIVSLGVGWPAKRSLGGLFGHRVGSRDQQAGTFMHELGHNLGLFHGGSEPTNCKPNYLSVMSYSRQFNDDPIHGRPLDYSRSQLPTLNEASLNEQAGISGPAGSQTAYGPPPRQVAPGDRPINWNRDDNDNDTGVALDINHFTNPPDGGCIADGLHSLTGHDDWANLRFDFQNTIDFADGVHLSTTFEPEITYEQAVSLSADEDGDGFADIDDNCPFVPNPDQADTNDDWTGDACTAEAPLAEDDAFTIQGGAGRRVEAPGVLANDQVRGGTLTTGQLTTTAGGTVQLEANGAFTYNSPGGFTGTDRFTYTLTNANGSDQATVTLTVQQTAANCSARPTRSGTARNDVLIGTAGRDVIAGLGGNDVLVGLGGDDILCGGTGIDLLLGGPGADYLDGGTGLDVLFGGPGSDTCPRGDRFELRLACEA